MRQHGKSEPALGWNIHNSIGIVHYLLGDPAAAREHFIAAADLAERVGSLRDLAQPLVSRGIMEAALGNEDESDRLYAESLQIHTRIQYQPGRAVVHSLFVKRQRAQISGSEALLGLDPILHFSSSASPRSLRE